MQPVRSLPPSATRRDRLLVVGRDAVGELLEDVLRRVLLLRSSIFLSAANESPSRPRETRPTPTPTDISSAWRTSPNANPVG